MERNNKATIVAVIIAVIVVGAGLVWGLSMNNGTTDEGKMTNATNTSNMADAQDIKDIVGVASDTSSLSTLVAAVKAADLVETLQAEGPYTVFAPTNAAFDALPAGTLDTLLKPENKEQLKSILTYHVVAGKVMAADLSDGQVVQTVQGANLTVNIMDGKVYLTDAKGSKVMVEKADVAAKNGVVHVISGVLLPS